MANLSSLERRYMTDTPSLNRDTGTIRLSLELLRHLLIGIPSHHKHLPETRSDACIPVCNCTPRSSKSRRTDTASFLRSCGNLDIPHLAELVERIGQRASVERDPPGADLIGIFRPAVDWFPSDHPNSTDTKVSQFAFYVFASHADLLTAIPVSFSTLATSDESRS